VELDSHLLYIHNSRRRWHDHAEVQFPDSYTTPLPIVISVPEMEQCQSSYKKRMLVIMHKKQFKCYQICMHKK